MKVTVTPTVLKPTDVHHVELDKSLDRIREGNSKQTVQMIRSLQREMDKCDKSTETGAKDYKALKKEKDSLKLKSLPAWSYSGVYTGRNNEGCTEASGLMSLDFDKVNVDYVKNELKNREYIVAAWESPSGNGVKALAKINPSTQDKDYKIAYKQIEQDLKYLDLDEACKDISRACFESYDPEIYVNDSPIEFTPEQIDVMAGLRGMIFKSEEGNLHQTRVNAGNYCGGLIEAGLITREEGLAELKRCVLENGTENPSAAFKDLEDGIDKGMTRPLPEKMLPTVEKKEKSILDKYPALSFVANGTEDLTWLKKLRDGEIEMGKETGVPSLDEHFRLKEGTFNVVMGRANVGKSTVIWWLMAVANMLHGWKWIVFSSENRSAIVKKELIQFITGNFTDNLSDFELEWVSKYVDSCFKIIAVDDLITGYELLEMAEELMKMDEYKGCMIDPYNSLKVDSKGYNSSYEYHYEFISYLKVWASTNNCAVYLNTHVGTIGARKIHQQGDLKGYASVPEKFDVENGVMFDNKADDFIVVHRYVQHPELSGITEWHQKKVKEMWSGGCPTFVDQPVKLQLKRVDGFNSFYDDYNRSPLSDAYCKLKQGFQSFM